MLKDPDACSLPHSPFLTRAGHAGKQLASVSAAYLAFSRIITPVMLLCFSPL